MKYTLKEQEETIKKFEEKINESKVKAEFIKENAYLLQDLATAVQGAIKKDFKRKQILEILKNNVQKNPLILKVKDIDMKNKKIILEI